MLHLVIWSCIITETEREIQAEQHEIERVEYDKQATASRRASAQANAPQVIAEYFVLPSSDFAFRSLAVQGIQKDH
jgi:hypothetical protein